MLASKYGVLVMYVYMFEIDIASMHVFLLRAETFAPNEGHVNSHVSTHHAIIG